MIYLYIGKFLSIWNNDYSKDVVDCEDEIPAVANKITAAEQIVSETKEARLRRLQTQYPIKWFYKKYGRYADCEDPHDIVPADCNFEVYKEVFTENQIKQIIINGTNFSSLSFDLRVMRIALYSLIIDIIKNPNNHSRELQKFIYHPDVLLGIIMYVGVWR